MVHYANISDGRSFSFLLTSMAANAPRPWGGCEDAREEKSRAEGERLETIKISVAKRHKDGTYSKRTKKSRAKRGDANYCISTAVRCEHGACIKEKSMLCAKAVIT